MAHELSVVAAVMETLIDEKQQMKALVEDYLTYTEMPSISGEESTIMCPWKRP